MIFRRKTAVCREGWYYLLVMAFVITGAILREVNLLMVMAGMMLFPFLFNWRAVVVSVRGLKFERRIPKTIAAGDLLVVDIKVSKRPKTVPLGGGASWGLMVEDRIQNSSRTTRERKLAARLMFWHLPAGGEQRASYQARLYQRGLYQFGPLQVSSRFPLGLLQRSLLVDQASSLVVLPRMGRLTERWSRLYQQSHAGARSSRRRVGQLEGDFHSLRDWRPNDGRRWIHWRTTARRGTPVVRQFEMQQDQDLALLVDLWQPRRAAPSEEDATERAVSFAATVVSDICRRGNSHLVLGVSGKDRKVLRGSASTGLMREMLETLATAQCDETDQLPDLMADVLADLRPGVSLVVLSPRHVDTSDSERFAALWEGSAYSRAGRIVTINTSNENEWAQYFEPS